MKPQSGWLGSHKKAEGTAGSRRLARLMSPLAAAALTVATLFAAIPVANAGGPAEPQVRLYIMSQCPFAKQVVASFTEILPKLAGDVRFNMDFIGEVTADGLTSMHGPNEVEGDVVAICLQKLWPEDYAWLKTLSCMMNDMRGIPNNWQRCAQEQGATEAIVQKVSACQVGGEGRGMLADSFKRSKEAGARGSPTMVFNGSTYTGGRTPMAVMRAVCGSMVSGSQPAACAALPPVQPVKALVISDERCTERSCETQRLEKSLSSMIPGLQVEKRLDWSSGEAKEICEREGIRLLPAYLFDRAFENSEEADSVKRYLKPTSSGKYVLLNTGAEFDPKAEICTNGLDDTGDGLADCDDAACRDSFVCRPEVPGQVEMFVMSQCPFAGKAFLALNELWPSFQGTLTVKLHFIGTDSGGKPGSMHGAGEVWGDILFQCVEREVRSDAKLVGFLACMAADLRNIEGRWKECAAKAGVTDVAIAQIEICTSNPGAEAALLKDFKVASSLRVTGSPTWVVNGKHKFNGIVADAIRKQICAQNPALPGCAM